MIERRRPQRRGQLAHRFGRDVDVADHRLHAVDHLRREPERQEIADRPGHVDFQAGQRLAELVVQFPRKTRALGLAGRMQAGGQPPQLAFGLAQTVLNLQARGDVAADAFDGDQTAAGDRESGRGDDRPRRSCRPDGPTAAGWRAAVSPDRPETLPRPAARSSGWTQRENQVRVGVKLLRAASRHRQAGGVDVVVASRRRDPIAIDNVSSVFEQALKQLLSLRRMNRWRAQRCTITEEYTGAPRETVRTPACKTTADKLRTHICRN